MMRRFVSAVLVFIMAGLVTVRADEGMFLVNMMEKGLIRDMRAAGLKLAPNVIYDEEEASLNDAVIALDFFCSGSIISEKGLLITNHHCAYGDVHALSTPGHNYLEEGFWAFRASEEKPIPGRSAFFLRKVIDVTEEVEKLFAESGSEGKKMGGRKVSYLIEKKYHEEYGMEASLGNMWRSSRYYMFLYDKFSDVRLVAAPPVSIAAFGGETDNWEWPQHKGDFALYRVYCAPDGTPAEYSPENVPMAPKRHLAISTRGVKMGDFTMIMGYPGHTNRYSSSFEADFIARVQNPLMTPAWKAKLEIINGWSERNDSLRLKYADEYFSISNVQENYAGAAAAIRRYGVVDRKKKVEDELQRWLDERGDSRREIIRELGKAYQAREELEKEVVRYKGGIVGGCGYFPMASRLKSSFRKTDSLVLAKDSLFMAWAEALFSTTDPRVEHDLFVCSMKKYASDASQTYRGDIFNSALAQFGGDAEKMAEDVWSRSFITDGERFNSFITAPHTKADVTADPLVRIFSSISIKDINDALDSCSGYSSAVLSDLRKDYTQALYEMRLEKGVPQYPDANSTLRLTYGSVCDIAPRDGVRYGWYSTSTGILEKYDPSFYDYHLNDRQLSLLKECDWGRWADADGTLHVNFMSSNDITGGNSGSAVLNARGELIGLAFDGNKESLCSDIWFEPAYCKCVNVDIRYVLWILDKYAGMNYIFGELDLK